MLRFATEDTRVVTVMRACVAGKQATALFRAQMD